MGYFDGLPPISSLKALEKPAPKRSLFAAANDLVIEAGNAVAGGAGALANMVSPGNRFSQGVDEFIRSGEESQSDAVKAEKRRFQLEQELADGFGEEAGAALRYGFRNPGMVAAQAAGSFAGPGFAVKGGGLVAKALMRGENAAASASLNAAIASGDALAVRGALEGAKRAIQATETAVQRGGLAGGVAAGAALSGGDAAGEAYELAIKAGATEDEATAIARQASALPAVVGGAGGLIGAERLLAGIPGKAGRLRNAATGLVVEGAQEGFEEGLTNYEARRAAQQVDPSIDPWKGTGAAAALGAMMGGATGGALGLISRPADPIQAVAEAKTVDEAAAAASRAVDVPLTAEQAAAKTRADRIAAATAEARREMAGIPLFDVAQMRGARSPEAALAMMEALARGESRENISDWSALVDAPPAQPEAPWLAEARAAALADQAEVAKDARREAIMSAPVDRAPRTKREEQDPAAEFNDELLARTLIEQARNDGTPAGRALAQDFDAGRVSVADVMDTIRRNRQPSADERLAAAAAQAKPVDSSTLVDESGRPLATALATAPAQPQGEVKPTDLLTVDGKPYGTRSAATARARREGDGEVVEAGGGFVVRKESDERQPDVAAVAAVPDGGAAGQGDQPGGGLADVGRDPAIGVGLGGDAAELAAGPAQDRPAQDAGQLDAALTAAPQESIAGSPPPAQSAAQPTGASDGQEEGRRQEVLTAGAATAKVARPPKSFRKKAKVKTMVLDEESGSFQEQEIDADSALSALDADIKELEAFLRCVRG